MNNDQYKLFLRYLKERGLYSAFVNDAKKFPSRRFSVPMKTYILSSMVGATEAIMNMIAWSEALYNTWNEEYREYQKFYTKIINCKRDKDEFFREIKKIIQ